jgi:primosomal protein N' (replication factor Y) (superfamily II helicase)
MTVETLSHGAPPRSRRTVRVRTEVAALPKEFDYRVPEGWSDDVRVGTRVRVPLHGRSVRGWVVADDLPSPEGVDVLPLKSWLGWGPPAPVVELASWASWRWAGPQSFFLRIASPPHVVRGLPRAPALPAATPGVRIDALGTTGWEEGWAGGGTTMLRLPPATDLIELVLSVLERASGGIAGPGSGSVLVLVPATGWAERLSARLVRRGVPVARTWDEARAGWPVVVGSRAAAWAPLPHLAAAVVLDAHDAAYREESSPTYSAVDVVVERARREGVPCVLASPVPPVALATLPGLRSLAPSPARERAGWPALERVDRRGADPRTGLFSDEFVRLARSVLDDAAARARGPLVCVYNRTGGARILACRSCGELARCARCGSAVGRSRDEEVLRCGRCGETRPVVCASCGRLRMKTLRAGVSRLREELTALLGFDVGEVAGTAGSDDDAVPDAPVLVGTEAVLHRVRRAAAVSFLDIDLHLLSPRLSATEETLALLVRAGRLVGARGTASPWARVQVQTRVPDHAVLDAAARGEPAAVLDQELDVRRISALPPFAAVALLSGSLAPAFVDAFGREEEVRSGVVEVSSLGDDRYLLRAASPEPLCDALARAPRPPGRGLRVEVDPPSV